MWSGAGSPWPASANDSVVFAAPGQGTATLDAGEHALWTPSEGLILPAEDVTITGPGGDVAVVQYISASTKVTITKGSTSYSPDVTFTAPTTGSYTIEVAESAPSLDVLVGPPTDFVGDTFIVIAASFGVATLIGVIGLILLIVGLVQRSRAKKAGQPPVGPGGYAPQAGYAPQPGYAPPPAAPQPGYQPPAAPPPTYGQPQPGYGQPPAGPPPGS